MSNVTSLPGYGSIHHVLAKDGSPESYVISKYQCWYPGSFDSFESAKYALTQRFSDSDLQELQDRVNPESITLVDLFDLKLAYNTYLFTGRAISAAIRASGYHPYRYSDSVANTFTAPAVMAHNVHTVSVNLGRGMGHTTWALKQNARKNALVIFENYSKQLLTTDISSGIVSVANLDSITEIPQKIIILDAASSWISANIHKTIAYLSKFVIGTDKVIVKLG